MKYFENFPIIEYEGRRIRDISRRSSFVRALSNNPYIYYPYTVSEGERAEEVAHFYYGSVDYVWLVYMANNIIDPYHEWPMDPQTFNDYIVEKYTEESPSNPIIFSAFEDVQTMSVNAFISAEVFT